MHLATGIEPKGEMPLPFESGERTNETGHKLIVPDLGMDVEYFTNLQLINHVAQLVDNDEKVSKYI